MSGLFSMDAWATVWNHRESFLLGLGNTLMTAFFALALAFAGLSMGVIRTGIIALGVYTGAYMGEVVRAAIESVPKGQFEAAQAQGFGYLQRMAYIILPQSIPVMLPPMVN